MATIRIITHSYPPKLDGVAAAAAGYVDRFRAWGHDVVVHTSPVPAQLDQAWRPARKERICEWRYQAWSYTERGGARPELLEPPNAPLAQKLRLRRTLNRLCRAEYVRFVQALNAEPADLTLINGWETMLDQGGTYPLHRDIHGPVAIVSHSANFLVGSFYPRFPWGLYGLWRNARKALYLPGMMRRAVALVFLADQRDWVNYLDNRLAVRLVPDEKRFYIPNPVPADCLAAAVGGAAQPADGPLRLLHVGMFSGRKDQLRLVDLFLRAELPNAELTCIGPDPGGYKEAVTARFGARLTGRVRLVAGASRAETLRALAECSLAALCSRQETQPIFLLEAMALGKPFVSTAVGCVAQFPGGLVARTDADYIRALRALSGDPLLRQRLGQAGSGYVRELHTEAAVARRWRELLGKCGIR